MEPIGANTLMSGNLKVQSGDRQREGRLVFKAGELRAAYHHLLLTDSWKSPSGKRRRLANKRGTLPAPRTLRSQKGCSWGRKPHHWRYTKGVMDRGGCHRSLQIRQRMILKAERAHQRQRVESGRHQNSCPWSWHSQVLGEHV